MTSWDTADLRVCGQQLLPTKSTTPSFADRVSAMRMRLDELRRNAQTVERWLDEVEGTEGTGVQKYRHKYPPRVQGK